MKRTRHALIVRLVTFILNLIPDRILVIIKAKIQIIRKMDYPRHDIFLNINSEIEYHIRLHSAKKEPEMIEWIETFFADGDVFYDVGANVGAYSIVASKYFNGRVKVYAFEPGFTTFPELCLNIQTNKCWRSIVPLQIALSDKTDIDVLNYENLTPGGALHALGDPLDYKGDEFVPVLQQPVLSFRVDDLVKYFHLPLPTHIKVDVDGTEFKILQGAEETLTNPLVKSVIVEIQEGNEEAGNIMAFLKRKGLNFHSKHRYVYGGPLSRFSNVYNYIFSRTHQQALSQHLASSPVPRLSTPSTL